MFETLSLALPSNYGKLFLPSDCNNYFSLSLLQHHELDTARDPCEQSLTYSLTQCVEESVARKVGCSLAAVTVAGLQLPLCQSPRQYRLAGQTDILTNTKSTFREYHAFYSDLNNAEDAAEIENITGCQKPCHYLSYQQVKPLTKYSIHGEDTCFVSVWVASPSTTVQTEVLLYPWTSLVAELGGTLGLFLGVSIMTLWDGGLLAGKVLAGIFK